MDISGDRYHRRLPHLRLPGAKYHVRFSVRDSGTGLSVPWMFEVVEESILFPHRRTCLVYGYVIMPNHGHLVMQPLPKGFSPSDWYDYRKFHRLEDIIGKLKSYSGLQINRRTGREGSFWESEYFDRIIRSDRDLEYVLDYIHHNPVRWKLVDKPSDYRWSSAWTIYSGRREYANWFDF